MTHAKKFFSAQEFERRMNYRDRASLLLQRHWSDFIANPEPPDLRQMRVWLESHSLETMSLAVLRTGQKIQNLPEPMSLERAVRFASKVANLHAAKLKAKRLRKAA
jgi:hypothetical protein